MMNILLFIHVVIALLLIAVILLQKTGSDGLSGIGGNNMGIVSARSASNFLTKTTIILAALFFINALVLANLSTKKTVDLNKRIQEIEQKNKENALPLAE